MLATAGFGQNSTVYFTNDISPESLVKIYEALGVTPKEGQRVAVKISTGESSQSNHLRPEFIKNLVQKVNGNIVECNTAYGENRSTTANHKKAIEQRGYGEIATVDIMDEEGTINLPVTDTRFFANFTVLDEAPVTIGDDCFIGPNVSIYTACHSTDPVERNSRREWAEPVSIGNNVWIGGSVTILPGVTIGDNVTIGAGSVVPKDIPSNSIAVGNPCKVIKKLESAL